MNHELWAWTLQLALCQSNEHAAGSNNARAGGRSSTHDMAPIWCSRWGFMMHSRANVQGTVTTSAMVKQTIARTVGASDVRSHTDLLAQIRRVSVSAMEKLTGALSSGLIGVEAQIAGCLSHSVSE